MAPDPDEGYPFGKDIELIGNCVHTAGGGTTITWSQIRNGMETLIAGDADIVPAFNVTQGEILLKLTCTDASGSNFVTMPIHGGTRVH